MSPAERRDVRRAVDGLVFGTIAPQVKVAACARNNTMGPPSANMFELVGQRFTPGDEWLAVRAGGAQHVWKVGQVQFHVRRPWETGGTFARPTRNSWPRWAASSSAASRLLSASSEAWSGTGWRKWRTTRCRS